MSTYFDRILISEGSDSNLLIAGFDCLFNSASSSAATSSRAMNCSTSIAISSWDLSCFFFLDLEDLNKLFKSSSSASSACKENRVFQLCSPNIGACVCMYPPSELLFTRKVITLWTPSYNKISSKECISYTFWTIFQPQYSLYSNKVGANIYACKYLTHSISTFHTRCYEVESIKI